MTGKKRVTKAELEDILSGVEVLLARRDHEVKALRVERDEMTCQREYWIHHANHWKNIAHLLEAEKKVQGDAIVTLALQVSDLERRIGLVLRLVLTESEEW